MLRLAVETYVTAAKSIPFTIVYHNPKWAGPLTLKIYIYIYTNIYTYIHIKNQHL